MIVEWFCKNKKERKEIVEVPIGGTCTLMVWSWEVEEPPKDAYVFHLLTELVQKVRLMLASTEAVFGDPDIILCIVFQRQRKYTGI